MVTPQTGWQVVRARAIEAVGKFLRPGAELARGAVHVQGHADHHRVGLPFLDQFLDLFPFRDAVFGTRSIGVAVGQMITGQARELCNLKAENGIPKWEEIDKLIKEWQPDAMVVGMPLNMRNAIA